MTVQNPAIFLQAGSHPAEDVRRYFAGVTANAEGVLMVPGSTSSSLSVTEKSGTPDMSVDVAEGSCLIAGTEGTYQGTYFAENRGTTNLVIGAADATNERYDLIVAKVEDSDYSGATDAWSLAVVAGTPAASPADPTTPDNSITLARVSVPALDTSIEDAQITDLRPWARLFGESATDTAGNTNCPVSTTTLLEVTFVDPGRPIFLDATVSGGVYHSADLTVRKTASYWLDYSIDGGSSYTTMTQASVDIKQGDGGAYRHMWNFSASTAAVLPTGDVLVRLRHSCPDGSDLQTRYGSLSANWRPA